MKILVVEDDSSIADFIVKGLTQAGHLVQLAREGKEGLMLAMTESFDALILDRMLPGMGGMDILKALRATQKSTPVLILSSLADVEHRVEGLRAGADDYLVKPFSFIELSARMDGLLRRAQGQAQTQTQINVLDLEIDLMRHSAKRAGRSIELQAREYKLLEYLARHANQVVSRTMILEAVWDYHFDPQTNVIDVHISKLRQKLEIDGLPNLIHTIRGAGYLLGSPS